MAEINGYIQNALCEELINQYEVVLGERFFSIRRWMKRSFCKFMIIFRFVAFSSLGARFIDFLKFRHVQ